MCAPSEVISVEFVGVPLELNAPTALWRPALPDPLMPITSPVNAGGVTGAAAAGACRA